jgi:hypothetical protein
MAVILLLMLVWAGLGIRGSINSWMIRILPDLKIDVEGTHDEAYTRTLWICNAGKPRPTLRFW